MRTHMLGWRPSRACGAQELQDLLSQMLAVEPGRRIDVLGVLRHQWLRRPADAALAALDGKPSVWTAEDVTDFVAKLQPG